MFSGWLNISNSKTENNFFNASSAFRTIQTPCQAFLIHLKQYGCHPAMLNGWEVSGVFSVFV